MIYSIELEGIQPYFDFRQNHYPGRERPKPGGIHVVTKRHLSTIIITDQSIFSDSDKGILRKRKSEFSGVEPITF